MESSKIKIILFLTAAAFFAVYLGVAAATNQFEAIAWIAGILMIVGILAMGRQVWMLIPFGLVLQGTINALPGSPPVWAFGAIITFVIFTMRFALRKRDFASRFDMMDFAVLLNLVAVGQAYIRNPTSFLMLGGELAGGKPYATFAMAILVYFFLGFLKTDVRAFKIAVLIMIVATLCDGIVGLATDWLPTAAAFVLPFYSNANFSVAQTGSVSVNLDVSRGGGGFGFLGRSLGMIVLSFVRPIRCLLPTNPLQMGLMALSLGMVLLSGFRSMAAYLLVFYIVSAIVRRTYRDIAAVLVVALLGLVFLNGSGFARKLPFGAQRILSEIPFMDVEESAKFDADNSSEWRFEMWRLALTTERYIRNKVLGDGFAISAREMRAQLDAAQGFGDGTTDADRIEAFMLRGSFHGFHVEAIRFTGIIGLAAAVFLMFVCLGRAWTLLKHYRGTPLFGYTAFLLIPFLISPFWSLLVFGAYRAEFPQFLATAGMLKMLDTLRLRELAELRKLPSTEDAAAGHPSPSSGSRFAGYPALG